MVKDENKTFDPDVTKWFGWAYLISTMLYYLTLPSSEGPGMVFFIGDHSLYTIAALGWALDGVEKSSFLFQILKFCGFLGIGLLLSVIPVCVAAIWKKKELPLLIFNMANMIDEAILAADTIVHNNSMSDAISIAALFMIHILCNAAFSVLLLRQYRAKRAHLRQTAVQRGGSEQ